MQELNKLTSLDLTNQNVFIVGKPASGKTFLSNFLHKMFTEHIVIHTDDFIKKEFLLADELTNIVNRKKKYILEGNKAYTILKEIDKSIYPNIIIDLIVSDTHVLDIYKKERDVNKYDMALGFYYYRKSQLDNFLSTNPNQIIYYFLNQSYAFI